MMNALLMGSLRSVARNARNGLHFAATLVRGYTSQYGQDRWVIQDMFGGMRAGFFVDVGASDGWLGSNTYVLEKKYGWSGICIEPNDRFFAKLRRNRSCTSINVCVADRECEVQFSEAAGTWGGIVDAYPQDHGQKLIERFGSSNILDTRGKLRTVTKKAQPLAQILRAHQAPRVIDYMSMDTECSEYIILKEFPFEDYTFLTATIEHGSVVQLRDDLRKLFAKHGYTLVRENECDDFYCHPQLIDRRSSSKRV